MRKREKSQEEVEEEEEGDARRKKQWQMVRVNVEEMVLPVGASSSREGGEKRGRFREPRSTFNHLRSITSAEVMVAFLC